MKNIYEFTEIEWTNLPQLTKCSFPMIRIYANTWISSLDQQYYVYALVDHIDKKGKIKESIWDSLNQESKEKILLLTGFALI